MTDWAANTRLVLDDIAFGYNDTASPPTLSTVTATYRVLLPSGRFTAQMSRSYAVPAGATSRQAITHLTNALAALQTAETLAP